ncbi:MAG TPA: YbaK/EbsC family protein [Patescibacteria group bacterium]|nr:YbaK/EbsC family protein [Patescibacteria group bacterium]
MNTEAFEKIQNILKDSNVEFQVYEHEQCRSSEESAQVRKRLGIPDAVGAKALLCKLYVTNEEFFATLVLPGVHVLDKKKLKSGMPGFKLMRFATSEELTDLAGVTYGCMPPFGSQVFPKISKFYISSQLKNFERLAFNAAFLEKSITLKTTDYLSIVKPDAIFDFSNPK